MEDIFQFWQSVPPSDHIHPADREVFARVSGDYFSQNALPGCYMGPLRIAPIVLLFLSPGASEEDEPTEPLIDWHLRTRAGMEPLISKSLHASAFRWWTTRTKFLERSIEERAQKVAILNIGAYHSKTFEAHGLLAALPSSRVALDWAQNVLFRQAEAGERVVICLRAAKYWGLEAGREYSGTLFAPRVTRGGHILHAAREKIVAAAQRAMDASVARATS
jgi:hypothetical protein